MEENSKKHQPSIPANYVSILQLQERWIKEKERKQKEKEEQEKQRPREEEREILEAEREHRQKRNQVEGLRIGKLDNKGLVRKDRRFSGRNYRRKESDDGGEASRAEVEVAEVIVAVMSERGANETKGENLPKVKGKKKKKNKARAEKVVVGGEADAPPVKSGEDNIPANREEIRRDYRRKRVRATEEKAVSPRVNVATASTAEIEQKLGGLSISGGKERGDNRDFKSNRRFNRDRDRSYRDNKWHNQWFPRLGERNPPRNSAMVWVKKGEIDGSAGGSGAISSSKELGTLN